MAETLFFIGYISILALIGLGVIVSYSFSKK